MKSLQRRFNNIIKMNPYWSSYICFTEAVIDQRFSRQTVHRWFNKIVDKNDYDKKDKKIILSHLLNLSNGLEDNQK